MTINIYIVLCSHELKKIILMSIAVRVSHLPDIDAHSVEKGLRISIHTLTHLKYILNWTQEANLWQCLLHAGSLFNTLRPRQNGRLFVDDTFIRIFLIENVWISIKISLKFVPKGPINNIPALVQIMAWCRLGDKPLSETMLASLLTHICVTRPQWVNMWIEHICSIGLLRHIIIHQVKKPLV